MKILILFLTISCHKIPDQKTIYANLRCPDTGIDLTVKPHEIRMIYDGVYEVFAEGTHQTITGNCVLTKIER